jgi:hypothetical protein
MEMSALPDEEIVHGRNWELVEYNWNERTGVADFVYENRGDSRVVSFSMQQEPGVPPAISKWNPRGGGK